MKEYVIHSLDDLLKTIADFNDEHGHYSWFRGQKDCAWHLQPSIKRPPFNADKYEQYMATNFYTETCIRMKDHPSHDDMSAWLCLMQHYGLPTRLLDWSESPLVALYFAVQPEGENDKSNNVDAALWLMDPLDLNINQGYGEYIPPMDYRTVSEMLIPVFNDKLPSNDRIIACSSVENDLRMYVQQSVFTIHGTNTPLDVIYCQYNILRKLIIPFDAKSLIRLQLRMLGFKLSTIFPDVEHVALEIKDN